MRAPMIAPARVPAATPMTTPAAVLGNRYLMVIPTPYAPSPKYAAWPKERTPVKPSRKLSAIAARPSTTIRAASSV